VIGLRAPPQDRLKGTCRMVWRRSFPLKVDNPKKLCLISHISQEKGGVLLELTLKDKTKGGDEMHSKTYLLVALVLVMAMGMGCSSGGSSSGGGGTDNTVNVSGTWKGTGNSSQTGTLPTTLILGQSGNNVAGTWDGLAVTGAVSGNQLALTFTPFIQNGVNMTGGGLATVTGNSMSGNFSVTGTKGTASTTINATFTATRVTSSAGKIADHAPMGGLVGAAVNTIAN
jgi:hypothetical protein